MNPETFTVTLRALPHWPSSLRPLSAEQRLRAALKRLLRDHGLRCESVERVLPGVRTTAGKATPDGVLVPGVQKAF